MVTHQVKNCINIFENRVKITKQTFHALEAKTPTNLTPCQRSHGLRFEPGTAANRALFKAQSRADWTKEVRMKVGWQRLTVQPMRANANPIVKSLMQDQKANAEKLCTKSNQNFKLLSLHNIEKKSVDRPTTEI